MNYFRIISRTVSTFLLACVLTACVDSTQAPEEKGIVPKGIVPKGVVPEITHYQTRKNDVLLEREYARVRAARLSDVHYDLSIRLPAENVPFSGTAAIHFSLKEATAPLTFDFVEGEVSKVVVNGAPVNVDYNGVFITVLPESLREGKNTVEVEYTHAYRRDGRGLHWFQDPVDQETYLFTQFEAWDFNKVFPGFDQPDLKATYQLDVEAPSHWQVISATRETSIEEVGDGRKRWSFAKTTPFSTYVLSLHAGPYKMWEEEETFRVPLRLFARQSYAEFVDVEEWFKVTRQGFDFFEGYFEYDYPFGKYDQILVPEFVFGAMENVGAVTFTERLQPRREKNTKDRQTMAVVVMHEMAHHWFGDLVTMRWWDDIWLNESFADLMGNFATANATEYTGAMVTFSTNRKSWGYNEDQWITTHPIVQDIPNTEVVMASIDGITYAKGASSLIQLMHLLGPDTFRQGLVNYFDTYAWKNTELTDFIGSLSQAANRDLSQWTDQWLKTSGVNALQAKVMCEQGKITRFDLTQRPANVSGAIREHGLDVLLVSDAGERSTVDVTVREKSNVLKALNGKACPAFVLPNVSDHTFVQILLGQKDVAYLQKHFGDFDSAVERGMIWRSLIESVRAGELSAIDYLDLALNYLPKEQNSSLLQGQLSNTNRAYGYLVVGGVNNSEINAQAKSYQGKLEAMAWHGYQNSTGAVKRQWFGMWLSMLHSPKSIAEAEALLAGKDLTLDDRWTVVKALMREQQESAQQWVETLSKEDNSSNAKLNKILASIVVPDNSVKAQWISEAQNPKTEYAYTQMRSITRALFPLEQHEEHLAFTDTIVNAIPELAETLTPVMLSTYASNLIPRQCSLKAQQKMLELAALENMPGTAVKTLKKLSQSEEECVAVQKRLEQDG
ncbi:aminopeptidase N [Marinibactrum halimedae]|nr:aminopeptidase N [Marinibactrum halimedae]MCD9458371.1 aminopeptidase N [Marinibactrum halimedae]